MVQIQLQNKEMNENELKCMRNYEIINEQMYNSNLINEQEVLQCNMPGCYTSVCGSFLSVMHLSET
jgi:hypothetical protein